MITRRDFLKGAGVVALAAATSVVLTGCDSGSSTTNTPAPAPDPSEPVTPAEPTTQTITLANGITLTITGTTRANVLTNGSKQYVAVKFKLNNTTDTDFKFTEKHFLSDVNGKWERPVDTTHMWRTNEKTGELEIARPDLREFFLETADAPYISYYEEEYDAATGSNGVCFGAAHTNLEAAICYMIEGSKSTMNLYVYDKIKNNAQFDPASDAKVFQFALNI